MALSSVPFLLHIHDFLSVFPLSATDDEFVSLSPTVPAIINHMVLHLQHTHTRKHTDARSRSKQSSLWLWSAICIPSQSGPPVFHCVCVWFVSMTLTWNPLYRRRYSHWRRPHTPLRADTCSPDSHYSPARSAGPRSLVNTHTLSDMEIRIKLHSVWATDFSSCLQVFYCMKRWHVWFVSTAQSVTELYFYTIFSHFSWISVGNVCVKIFLYQFHIRKTLSTQ